MPKPNPESQGFLEGFGCFFVGGGSSYIKKVGCSLYISGVKKWFYYLLGC